MATGEDTRTQQIKHSILLELSGDIFPVTIRGHSRSYRTFWNLLWNFLVDTNFGYRVRVVFNFTRHFLINFEFGTLQLS